MTRHPWPARLGRYVSLIMHGGSELPALTPSRPPHPSSTSAVELEHLDAEPGRLADLGGEGGEAGRREVARR